MNRYRVTSDREVDLSSWDPADHSGFDGGKHEGKKYLAQLRKRLSHLQRLLWAEDKHKILVVLQAMDTGGKDGTIRKVFTGINPQGIDVQSFKTPTAEELAHDYLWRVHQHAPATGSLTIFNRSHYEDVLIVRVLGLVPEERWRRRFDHINQFEKLLADEGTTIIKFFLHISPGEQAERLQARIDNPTKNWKFNSGDLDQRKLWPDYVAAYEDVLARTSTDYAPWYVVPADHKWYRNIVVAETIVAALEALGMHWPEAEEELEDVVIPDVE